MFDQTVSPAAVQSVGDKGTGLLQTPADRSPSKGPADRPLGTGDEPDVQGSPADSGGILRLLRAAVLMAVAVALVTAERVINIVPGVAETAVFALVVLALPTSRQLSRRILLAGCLFFGWVPVLYWWDLPVGQIGRTALLFAVILALLVGWIAVGRHPGDRLRQLMPRLRVVDVLPLVAALATAALLWKWLQAKTGVGALAIMIPGWDHSAHYAMTHSIRLHDVTTQGLAGTPGGGSPFEGYPQSFHATVASVMELLGSTTPGTAEAEIVLYTQSVGLVLVAAVAMLCAGLCALPSLRRRPLAALPLAALIGSAFVLGPGGAALQDGFPNLVLATALVAAIPMITVPLNRLLNPVHLAAVGGAIVGIAHGWAPLLLLALPGLVIALFPLARSRWRASRSSWWLSGLAVAATTVCLAWAVLILAAIPLEALAAPGGVSAPVLGLVLAVALGCLAVCLVLKQIGPASGEERVTGPIARTAWLAVLPIVGLVGAAALAGYQLSTVGEVSYYFWKFIAALGLVCVVGLAIGAAGLVARLPHRRTHRLGTALAAGALTLALTQVFGLAGPNLPSIDIPVNAPGATARDASERLIRQPPLTAEMINDVDRFRERFPGQPVFYISAPSDGRTRGYSMTQWFLGLTDTWTMQAQATVEDSQLEEDTFPSALDAVERVLRAGPDNIVAVGPEIVDDVRRLLDRDLADRVVSW